MKKKEVEKFVNDIANGLDRPRVLSLKPMPDPERSFSWSAISSFEWSKEQWYVKYVLHQKCTYESKERGTIAWCFVAGCADPDCPVVKKTPELAFGTYVDVRIQEDPKFIPKLVRYPVFQHEMKFRFDGIPLIGIADAWRPPLTGKDVPPATKKILGYKDDRYVVPPALRDYKTGRKPWDQKRADDTGQLTMYAALLWLTQKIRPEDVQFFIDWLPTHYVDNKIAFIESDHRKLVPVTFQTHRSMHDVMMFLSHRLLPTYRAMLEYAENHPERAVLRATGV